jgi:hypothetical protein
MDARGPGRRGPGRRPEGLARARPGPAHGEAAHRAGAAVRGAARRRRPRHRAVTGRHEAGVLLARPQTAPGDTWIPSGARVVDLDSGRLHTGPGRGPSGEGRLAWNFSWSPDGRYLAYATAADDSGFTQRDWFPPSEHGYELLDTTTYRPVDAGPGSQDTEGRPLPVAVSSAGTVFRNGNGQNLVARAGGRDHRRVATFGWRSAHINPSGDWLAAGDDDGISMVLERAVGRPSGSVVTVLPRREVASGSLVLLAWPTPTRLVAVRHRQVGPSSFSEDADLVRLTLNIDADDDAWVRDFPRIPRARMEIVGRVTGAEPGTVLSVATGLAAGDPPTREFEPPPFADGHDQPAAGGPTERSAGPTDEAATVPLRTVLLAVTLVALAAAAALLRAARRRVRAPSRRPRHRRPDLAGSRR